MHRKCVWLELRRLENLVCELNGSNSHSYGSNSSISLFYTAFTINVIVTLSCPLYGYSFLRCYVSLLWRGRLKWGNICFESDLNFFKITFERSKNALFRKGDKVADATTSDLVCLLTFLRKLQEFNYSYISDLIFCGLTGRPIAKNQHKIIPYDRAIKYDQYMCYLSLWFDGVIGLSIQEFRSHYSFNEVELVVLHRLLTRVSPSNRGVNMVIRLLSRAQKVTWNEMSSLFFPFHIGRYRPIFYFKC